MAMIKNILTSQVHRKLAVLFFSISIILLSIGFLNAAEYEPAQTLKASDVLPKSFFKSDLYKVDQKVKNDGLMNTYKVTSKHGNFEVISTVALYKLIVEIEAIDAMKKIQESDTFTKSLKESGTGTVDGIKNLFSDPEKSIKGAGKGLTSIFSRAGESIFQSSPGDT
jgi:hypothetical protein